MSSNESDRNGSCANQAWNQPPSGKDDPMRAPNRATESRVLSIIKNQQESQTQPRPDFSNPPPSQVSQSSSIQKSQEPLTLPQAPSVLSAEAQEFVPRSKTVYQSNVYGKPQYIGDDCYRLSVSAAEFVPRGGEEFNQFGNIYYQDNVPYNGYDPDQSYLLNDFSSLTLQEFDSSYDVQMNSTGNPILDRFNKALRVLNDHPGNMEEYLRPICEMIQQNPGSAEIVNDIVESLFKQSIEEANFRYTGARICQFLSSNLKSNPHFTGFHKIFFKRCQQEYNKREELKTGSPQDQERLRGLAMFMAELFLNVEAEVEDGVPQRLKFLPKILIEFVQTLLSKPNDLDVKCACQLLKLSGGLIEDIVKHTADECMKFEETISQLQSLQTAPDLSENAKFLIGSVIKLKENNWNRSTSSPPKKSLFSFTSESNNFQVPEPVFYNSMGAPCSRTEAEIPYEEGDDGAYVLNDEEEAAFLEWQAEQEGLTGDQIPWSMNDTGYDSYQLEETGDEGGMGDEVEAAYEEFLQEQSYIQGYQPPQPASIVPQPPAMLPAMRQMYSHPPPPMSQDFYGYQQGLPQPNMGVPGVPPNQMQPQQQQQQPQHPSQQPQYHQGPYQSNDRFHYRP